MLLLSLAFALSAQTAMPARPEDAPCPAIDAELTGELAGWRTTGTGVALGSSFQLPAQAGAASVTLPITTGGRYRVALDQGGWIDLVRDGKALESVNHGRGPRCTTIRKIVDFDLQPGSYTLRLTRLPRDTARVMVWPAAAAQKE